MKTELPTDIAQEEIGGDVSFNDLLLGAKEWVLIIASFCGMSAHAFYNPQLGRWTTRDPIGEEGGANLYAFCRNDPIDKYDMDGCAYFAYRPLDSPITRKLGVRWRSLDGMNWVLAHEQLVFEDGGSPVNIGYFDSNTTRRDEFAFQNQYVKLPGTYDDCVMREAVKNVKPRPYCLMALGGRQYNCQDYADDLRREYFRLLTDREIWCKCGLDRKGLK